MATGSNLHPVQNAFNAALIVLVAIPAVWYTWLIQHRCTEVLGSSTVRWTELRAWASTEQWCALANEPILAVNVIFFLNVCVLFWLISLFQRSTWLIDPYWTIIPVLIGLFYEHHPAAVADKWRGAVAVYLLWVWSTRLTHSYFRRERWQFGEREDWRFSDLAKVAKGHWWWLSFFLVYVSQQMMLVGISLPLAAIFASAEPWHPVYDTAIALTCAAGILIAYRADNELSEFVAENEERVRAGAAPVLLLDTGLWRYSRHPNYFGEQLWWWGLGCWAVRLGQPWMLIGTAFNSLCMVAVTIMVEQRMLAKPERAELFQMYQRTTSAWVPWFKASDAAGGDEGEELKQD